MGMASGWLPSHGCGMVMDRRLASGGSFVWLPAFGYGRSRGIWDWLWFSGGVAHCEGSLVSVFQGFFASVGGFSVWRVGWALGYHSMGFRHSPDI